jgi:pyruvate formate lyase activating enzyme
MVAVPNNLGDKEAMLYKKLPDGKVECYLCAHRCKIADSKLGICGVRQNHEGVLYTLVYGKVIAGHVDPIEKKPIFHMLPGSRSYSIATPGCNFKCGFCQNWTISQMTKGSERKIDGRQSTPSEIVRAALEYKCRSISYTYTEPTIFFEFAYDVCKLAREKGLRNVFVTNGYMTEECLDAIAPYLDAANVDLKGFSDRYYHDICGARLQPVLDSIKKMRSLGIWVEVTTLVVPTLNDSVDGLEKIVQFIRDTGVEIPWHISRFHPEYKMTGLSSTPAGILRTARNIGKKAGLRYVYLGNVLEEGSEDTHCYNCGSLLIERFGFEVLRNEIEDSKCPKCSSTIDGPLS